MIKGINFVSERVRVSLPYYPLLNMKHHAIVLLIYPDCITKHSKCMS